jgi:hypothetical protein
MIAPVLWLCALLDRDLHSVPSLPSLGPSSLATRYRCRGEKSSLERPGGRMKHVEYVLLTAFTGAIAVGLGTMMWPALSNLGTIFTRLAQALQVKP